MFHKNFVKRVQSGLSRCGIGITSASILADLRNSHTSWQNVAVVANARPEIAPDLLRLLDRSRSQLRQDLFVLSQLDMKRGGYFVEFGAADGETLSNTHLLEKEFGWNGVLAEPAQSFHNHLKKTRTCDIDTRLIWETSGVTVSFAENRELLRSAMESPVRTSKKRSRHLQRRYTVETVSLLDLLRQHGSPSHIDYLSIDVEGAEFQILQRFDFSEYEFGLISVEHAYRKDRAEILDLLSAHGYQRVFEHISWWDDWYLGPNL